MEFAEYMVVVTTVPETHAGVVREAMGRPGAGKLGKYSYCSFSVKGIGRFWPDEGAKLFVGEAGIIEGVAESGSRRFVRRWPAMTIGLK